MRRSRRVRGSAVGVFIPLILLATISWIPAGCGRTAKESESYFALEAGNSWLYSAMEEGARLSLELSLVDPDSSLDPSPGTVDVRVTGTLGRFDLSEQGYLLQADADSLSLVPAGASGADAYLMLETPLVTGRTYYSPAKEPAANVTVVTRLSVDTPSGARDGFELEVSGEGLASGASLVFVPHVGFTTISVPGFPSFELEDAALN